MKEDFKKFEKCFSSKRSASTGGTIRLANKHIAETQFASSPFPEDIFMVAILLEMHKGVMALEIMIYGLAN